MNEAANHLKNCYQQALARITDAQGNVLGTGCVVAPDRVLTCHHLFNDYGSEHTVYVQVNDATLELNLDRAYQAVAEQDLALLTLNLPEPISCVQLSTALSSRQPLFAQGYTSDFPQGDPISLTFTEQAEDEGRTYLKFKDDRVSHGFSGSPLLNEQTGQVVGLITETLNAGAALGGAGIPVAVIWQCFPELKDVHDAWHLAHPLWGDAQVRLRFDYKRVEGVERIDEGAFWVGVRVLGAPAIVELRNDYHPCKMPRSGARLSAGFGTEGCGLTTRFSYSGDTVRRASDTRREAPIHSRVYPVRSSIEHSKRCQGLPHGSMHAARPDPKCAEDSDHINVARLLHCETETPFCRIE